MRQYISHLRQLWMHAVAVIADSFECGQYFSLRMHCHSHKTIAMVLKLSDTLIR